MRALLAMFLVLWSLAGSASDVQIAAAANLRFALQEVAGDFEHHTGHRLAITYGSSGQLARQIAHGAPYSLFFSASEEHVEPLVQAGLGLDAGRRYARGQLLLVDRGALSTLSAEGLQRAWRQGEVVRFGVANPAHAPYGAAAIEALKALSLSCEAGVRCVTADNVVAAGQLLRAGAVEAAIVSASLAHAQGWRLPGLRQRLLPQQLHAPLHQRMLLLARGDDRQRAIAQAFADWVVGPKGQKRLAEHGFLPPEVPR